MFRALDVRIGGFRRPLLQTDPVPVPNVIATIIAHQGGWDEILLVIGPVALIGILLFAANRKARAQLAQHEEGTNHEAPK